MKNSFKSAATIFGICLVGVSLLYLALVFRPLYNLTQTLNDKHSVNLAQIKEYDTYIRESDKIESEIKAVDGKIAELKSKLPLTDQQIANDINTAFMENKILLKSISMTDETIASSGAISSTGDLLCSVTSNLAFEANESELMSLINYFENSSKAAYYITNLSVTSASEKANGISLILTAYYYAPSKNVVSSNTSSEITSDDEVKDATAVFE